jgi:hypothetical protein
MEVVDLVERRKNDLYILRCARRIFPTVETIVPVVDFPSILISREGELIAYGWVDEDGQVEFKLPIPDVMCS